MKLTILITILFLHDVVIGQTAEKVIIKCTELKSQFFGFVDDVQTCFSNSVEVETKNAVIDDKSKDAKIEAFSFYLPSQVKFIPKNLQSNYPKLKLLRFIDQPLNNLESTDLKQFGANLEVFWVSNGRLTFLRKNLFEFNSNLKYIDIRLNKLKYIENGFFDNIVALHQLEAVFMGSNGCIDTAKYRKDFKTTPWQHTCNDSTAIA